MLHIHSVPFICTCKVALVTSGRYYARHKYYFSTAANIAKLKNTSHCILRRGRTDKCVFTGNHYVWVSGPNILNDCALQCPPPVTSRRAVWCVTAQKNKYLYLYGTSGCLFSGWMARFLGNMSCVHVIPLHRLHVQCCSLHVAAKKILVEAKRPYLIQT